MAGSKRGTSLNDQDLDQSETIPSDSVKQEEQSGIAAAETPKSTSEPQELNAKEDELATSPLATATPRKRQKRIKPTSTPRQRYTKKWDPILVVTDAKSPLTKTKVLDILRTDEAWTSLSSAQQRQLLQYLPPSPSSTLRQFEKAMVDGLTEDEALPNIARMRLDASMAFKADVRQFSEELRQGKLDVGWIQEGMRASARRRRGEFDEWKVRERENQWGLRTNPKEDDVSEQAGDCVADRVVIEDTEAIV